MAEGKTDRPRLQELVNRLSSSAEYQGWSKENKGFYLVHMFLMTGHPPQLGYYNKDSDMIVTFDLDSSININPASEIFKEAGILGELKAEEIRQGPDEAVAAAQAVVKDSYPGQAVQREIIILQVIEGQAIYNITFISSAFKTINVRVDARSAEVISHQLRSIMDLQKE